MEFLKAEYASDSSESDTDTNVNASNYAENEDSHDAKNVTTNTIVSSQEHLSQGSNESCTQSSTEQSSTEAANYFGLQQSSDTSSSDEDVSHMTDVNTEKSILQVVTVGDSSVQVEIPNTSFWSEASNMDIQALQNFNQQTKNQKIKCQSTFDSRRKLKRSGGESEMSFYGNKFSKQAKHNKTEPGKFSKPETVQTESTSINQAERKLYFIHPKVTPLLHAKPQNSKSPRTLQWSQASHSGAVNRIQWCCQSYSHLLATCSMDATVKVWSVWSQLEPCVRHLTTHRKAVKDVVWSREGKHLLTASYDRTAAVTDVEKGVSVCQLDHISYVTCAKYHPVNPQLCVTGEQNQITVWDLRSPQLPCRTFTYKDSIGQIQDLLFSKDGAQLFSCSDLVSRDSSDRNVMAWDFSTGVVLSNQIYQERYTVTRLKDHPDDGHFLAQSQGNYVALFSTTRPYKIVKHKRLEGHKLLGYSIGFDVSPDGQSVYSGSSDGKVHRYHYQTGRSSDKLVTGLDIVMDVACHPVLPSTLATAGWDGQIQVWK